jgi:hypothetical protein
MEGVIVDAHEIDDIYIYIYIYIFIYLFIKEHKVERNMKFKVYSFVINKYFLS